MRRVGLIFVFVLGTVLSVQAQKIKYKDLFVLLNAKDYAQGESFLRKFLAQEADHPNANFNMALFYEYTMEHKDMLKESSDFIAYGDSTYSYFAKSYALITEREVKKNDDYYQEYYRRDLRTGKYGVKLADVQLDIETRMNNLKALLESVRKMASQFDDFTMYYDSAVSIHTSILTDFPDYKTYLFNSDEVQLSRLSDLGGIYSQCIKKFALYDQYREAIENAPYQQELAIKIIEGFKPDKPVDYYADRLDLCDFSYWADYTGGIIANDIIPLTNEMVEYDTKLDALGQEARNGENVIVELKSLSTSADFTILKNYDQNPLPVFLFKFKESEIKYYSHENQKKSDGIYDSINLDFQYLHIQNTLTELEKVGINYERVRKQDLADANKLYSQFITSRYTDKIGLKEQIDEMGSSLQQESDRIVDILESLSERMKWAVSLTDTLPMILTDSLIFQGSMGEKHTVTLSIDTLESGYIIGGLQFVSDSVSSYVANVSSNRSINALSMQTLISNFENEYLNDLQYFVIPSGPGKLYFIQCGRDSEKHFCLVRLVDTDSGIISWSKKLTPTARLASARIDDSGGLIMQFIPSTEGDEERGDIAQILNLGTEGESIEVGN